MRQAVKTYAPGFGFEVVEVPHRGGVTDPDELAAAAADAAAVLFQQPNFLGCLEPAPELAAAANDAGALSIAHVDLMSLGVLEAPGAYGCAIALGEGQSARATGRRYGGPHYGFLAARSDYVRRMPGRIVGETVDLDGRRAFVLTLQTREQHIRREKATSNITTNQTLLALAGLVDAVVARARRAARGGGDVPGARPVRERAARRSSPRSSDGRSRRSRSATPLPARDVIKRAREHGVNPGYALGRDYEGMEDVLLVALTEKRTPRTSTGSRRCSRRCARDGAEPGRSARRRR